MATSNFLTQKPFPLLLTISITFFLLLLTKVNSSEVHSFSIKNFAKSQNNLILQGDALVTPTGKLQPTKVENGISVGTSLIGRALYSTPIHIWGSSTQKVANFATYFSFVINATDKTKTADGLAFFLGPVDTQPQTGGGYLGLFNYQNSNSFSNQTVAVEFDTYHNQWDPDKTPHIGIDVNTIESKKTSSWGFRNGNVATVLITYQANSKTLVASLVFPSGKTSYIVSASVDLSATVPEWVRVGFSATTGTQYVETHDVLSWSFESKLPDSDCGVEENDIDLASFMVDDSIHCTSYF
uniref:Lectin n=1 Tax=Sophora flavescens TaxID=49840 RepID=A0A2H4X1W0_SOPFL|nr:lectin [Sophora flavescens]